MSDTSGISHMTERKRLLDLAAALAAIEAEKKAATRSLVDQRGQELAVMNREFAAAMSKFYAKYDKEIGNIAAPFEARKRAVKDEINNIEDDVELGAWRYDVHLEKHVVCMNTGLPIFEYDAVGKVEGLTLVDEERKR